MQTLNLNHRVVQPRRGEPGAPPPVLFLLHGVGADENDLLGVAPLLDERLMIISARAPKRYMMGGYSWFDIFWQPDGFSVDVPGVERAWRQVQEFIDGAVAAYGADPARVYLGGFSQGAIVSLGATLTRPEQIAGLIVMSGRWLPDIGPQADREHIAAKPIRQVHGRYDNVIQIEYGRAIRDFLTTLPVELSYAEYDMGHEVSYQSLQETSAWLSAQLDSKP